MSRVLNIILAHQAPLAIRLILERWRGVAEPRDLLIAHGGPVADFSGVEHEQKVYVNDPRLRTKDHQREFQSLTGVFHAVRDWLASTGERFDFIHLSEYDHLPLVRDLNARQVARIEEQRADVLAVHLLRVDGTNRPHYLYHASNPRFHPFFASITQRPDPGVVFHMFGAGPVWRREAFDAVAAREEPFPMYNEVYFPTLAHHLGFRVRDFADQNQFFSAAADRGGEIALAQQRGGWTLHPVKDLHTVVKRLLP